VDGGQVEHDRLREAGGWSRRNEYRPCCRNRFSYRISDATGFNRKLQLGTGGVIELDTHSYFLEGINGNLISVF